MSGRQSRPADRRLSEWGTASEPDAAEPREEEEQEQQTDAADDPPCADCDAEDAVSDASTLSDCLPSKPLCRVCARDYL